jgi:hypothetical protein
MNARDAFAQIAAVDLEVAKRPAIETLFDTLLEQIRAQDAGCFDLIYELNYWLVAAYRLEAPEYLQRRAQRIGRTRPAASVITEDDIRYAADVHARRLGVALWRLAIYGDMNLTEAQVLREIRIGGREFLARRAKRRASA